MFHKYNSLTNTLAPSDQHSAYVSEVNRNEKTKHVTIVSSFSILQTLGTKEATNNFFVAPQPKGRFGKASVANSSTSVSGLLTEKVTQAVSSATKAAHAPAAHGHGHGHHAEPWEGVNLWRTPYKGDVDTITHVKKSKGTLDQYVENRTRKIQQLQLFALKNKSTPTWVMMPRDKLMLGVQVALAGYVVFQVGSMVYNHLKAKDRIKRETNKCLHRLEPKNLFFV